MEFKNRTLIEKINQLRKAIEIVGGNEVLKENGASDAEFIEHILLNVFEGKKININVNGCEYKIDELNRIKQEYEKYFLKNKSKATDAIVYKIKKYDTSLDSEIRKYKKTNSIEMYNNIYDTIENRYRRDINLVVLKEIDSSIVEILTLEESQKYYGEYLSQKKKQIIHGIISKMGIV